MSEALKGALIGAGFFAQFHAEGWRGIAGAQLAAVVDLDGERAKEFAARWGIQGVYSSAAEMLDKERPDFVDIATRPESHLALTRLCAAGGAHVICQKPMAPSMDDCEEMVRTCAEQKKRLIIHENWRWQPWYREMRRLLETGRLGRLFHMGFRMRTGDGRGETPYPAQPYFREMPRLMLFETVVHFLDTFRYLGGEISGVYCSTQRINPVIAGEDSALVHVDFDSGAQGLIDGNRIAGELPPPVAFGELTVEGESAALRMTPDGDLWVREYGGPDGGKERPHGFEKPASGYKGDSVKAVQQHMFSCLVSGQTAESEGWEYLKTVALVEACYESARTGQKVGMR